MTPPAFDLAIVHHRTPELLLQTLADLHRHAPSARVTVLDTAFEATFGASVARRFPEVRVRPTVNHSYAHAVNEAVAAARHPHVAVMNADVRVGADTFAALHHAMGPGDVAAAGPVARRPDGRVQDQGVPYRLASRRALRAGPHGAVDAPWLSGCLILLRAGAMRAVGGWDTRLRFGNEDLEWCLRARRAGWRCRLAGTEVTHEGGSSTPDDARFVVEGLRGGMAVARRHHRPWRRGAQRTLVRWGCEAAARVGPPPRRPAYRAAAALFARGLFDLSPFGPTLDTRNPELADALGPSGDALRAPGDGGPRAGP